MKDKLYTLIIVTENNIGLLNHISGVFTRRHINIRSITASESKIKDVYTFTIVIKMTDDLVRKVAKQFEKIIGVFKVFVYDDSEIIHQELALYKLPVSAIQSGINLEEIVRKHNARVLDIKEEYILIEKTGHKDETQKLLKELEPFGILQFIRSGRVAMAKPMKPLDIHLREKEEAYDYF